MTQKSVSLNPSYSRYSKWSKITFEVINAILIILWLHTGISKLLGYKNFLLQMKQSPIFHDYAKLVTFGAPIMEIVLAILLIIKSTRLIGMMGSFLLMCFFTWYVGWLMVTMPNLPCSCGGIVGFLNWPQHLALNAFLSLLALVGIILLRKNRRHINA